MTKKLEDILNLPNVKQAFKEVDKKEKDKKKRREERHKGEIMGTTKRTKTAVIRIE